MWRSQIEKLSTYTSAVRFDNDWRRPSFHEVLGLWQHDAAFRSFFLELLSKLPFTAFRFELPPLTKANAEGPFECVIVDSPELAKVGDPSAFSELIARSNTSIVTFRNLSNDADLIVPTPKGPPASYAHLASFCRLAPEAQRHELWRVVGGAIEAKLGPKPVWPNTAGAGVPWLHVRLDDRPKYYYHRPYRTEPTP